MLIKTSNLGRRTFMGCLKMGCLPVSLLSSLHLNCEKRGHPHWPSRSLEPKRSSGCCQSHFQRFLHMSAPVFTGVSRDHREFSGWRNQTSKTLGKRVSLNLNLPAPALGVSSLTFASLFSLAQNNVYNLASNKKYPRFLTRESPSNKWILKAQSL